MRYRALATDYDGTLATAGQVAPELVRGLERLRSTGRKLVLVTGRVLDDLRRVSPALAIFDRIVAENGATLYRPASGDEALLAQPAPAALRARLAERGVPLGAGRVILATDASHGEVARTVLGELGLPWQIVLNRSSAMLLPAAIDKATGLAAALDELGIAPAEVVGVGDGENDLPLIECCGYGVAVGDAVPALRARAHLVLSRGNGAGVAQLVQMLLDDEL